MSIHPTFRSFNLALERYTRQDVLEFQKGRMTVIALEVMKGLTELTPVDTGRAKGNWQFTVGGPAEGEVERLDPSAAGTPSLAGQVDVLTKAQEWKPGDWMWFHNGVPYIGVLNDGTDTREAHHMLELTVERIKNWVGS